ncbi:MULTISPECIES: SAM-dependent methyltransferase [Niastella]|uniref:SAM-dependent methyltransferase n=1 Tax=Niastella soli TaxID=2821487 RepID=A0ABS3YRA9_9BACT|nr:SAM-dependent methyltransferase [Niastella soli]MBO9200403.1 SAM-dependent methyltransferase [Niastella soli]
MNSQSIIYLIPSVLAESATETIPAYVKDAVSQCQVFFVENERTARRYFKSIWKEMVIDNYTWVLMDKTNNVATLTAFNKHLKENKTIGIVSEAGCPGIADPGQLLTEAAHAAGAIIKPLVGPSSILLALMASGMNGQQFQFVGYLPIDTTQRREAIKELEAESAKKNCTQVFIETPYRNNQLLETLIKTGKPTTKLCVAADITAPTEYIHTKTLAEWKKQVPELHKRPAIFCMLAG